jgi:hypothetical protein
MQECSKTTSRDGKLSPEMSFPLDLSVESTKWKEDVERDTTFKPLIDKMERRHGKRHNIRTPH